MGLAGTATEWTASRRLAARRPQSPFSLGSVLSLSLALLFGLQISAHPEASDSAMSAVATQPHQCVSAPASYNAAPRRAALLAEAEEPIEESKEHTDSSDFVGLDLDALPLPLASAAHCSDLATTRQVRRTRLEGVVGLSRGPPARA